PGSRATPTDCRRMCALLWIYCRRRINLPQMPARTSSARRKCSQPSMRRSGAATASRGVCRKRSAARRSASKPPASRSARSTGCRSSAWAISPSAIRAITARVRLGRGEVVDIEREVELGGPLHSKGVLILSAYLGARYASDRPLSLSASLVFEQSYSGVEGDSASSTELYALLSALADLP